MPGWSVVSSDAGMYSWAEQGPGLRRQATNFACTWFPHFAHPWRLSGRWVCTVHDVIHLARPDLFPGRLRRAAARILLADVRDRAAAVCFVSRFTQAEFHRLVGPPVGREMIVGNGVDDAWFEVAPEGPPPHPRPYVIAVGNLKRHKGLSDLLVAMHGPACADLDVVLVGRKDAAKRTDSRLEDLIASLGPRCLWTGVVSDQDLHRWVAHARMLAFPSHYEGFGLPPLEAMAAGVPVVAADIPAIRETSGPAAELVAPSDPQALAAGIARLAGDANLRRERIAAGRQLAAGYRWQSVAGAMSQVTEAIV